MYFNKKGIVPVRLISLIFWLSVSGCTTITSGIYGIKKPKRTDDEEIIRCASKFGIPIQDVFVMDTSYVSWLHSFDGEKHHEEIKNHFQPLQELCFDKNGNLVSYQINCYAGGFPNLKWNRNGIMDTFPPKPRAPVDTLLSLNRQLSFITPLQPHKKVENDSAEYYVFIYWNRFMGRQSKRFVRITTGNLKLAKKKRIKVYYVNTDNLYGE